MRTRPPTRQYIYLCSRAGFEIDRCVMRRRVHHVAIIDREHGKSSFGLFFNRPNLYYGRTQRAKAGPGDDSIPISGQP